MPRPVEVKRKCNICLKVTNKNSVSCCQCKLSYHKTCNKLQASVNILYNDFLCQSCACLIFPFHKISDADIFEMFNPKATTDINANVLNQLFTETLDSENIDNDFNYTNVLNDLYVDAEEAKSLLNNNSTKNNHSFTTMCINARSLINPLNFTKLEGLVAALNYKSDVIGITETWENINAPVFLKCFLVTFIQWRNCILYKTKPQFSNTI